VPTPSKRPVKITMTELETVSKATKEQNLAKALAGLVDGTYANIHQAAVATGTSRRTLTRRYMGGQTRHEANINHQALSPNEEYALTKWVERLSCTGHPVHHSFLRALAHEIRRPRLELEGTVANQLGKHWVSRFLTRHPSLQSKVAKSIEVARKEVTEKQLQSWFTTFKHVIDEHGIVPDNVYNMDETGCL
jgi:Tc5 transposase DNA-binding domain